jgi:small nuclear ribonucleoprotein (snRNP)-like protein
MIRQFHKNIGKELEIVLKSGVKMNASLLSIENQMLTFLEIRKLKKNQPETTPITMNFEEIKSAKEVINFKS